MKKIIFIVCFFMVGCASQTTTTFKNLNTGHYWWDSNECKSHREFANEVEIIKWINLIISPIVVVASGGILMPMALATNTALDWDDKTYANNMSKWCGGNHVSEEQIMENTATNAVLNTVKNLFITNITNNMSTTK